MTTLCVSCALNIIIVLSGNYYYNRYLLTTNIIYFKIQFRFMYTYTAYALRFKRFIQLIHYCLEKFDRLSNFKIADYISTIYYIMLDFK